MVSSISLLPQIALSEVLTPIDRSETPAAGTTYRMIGVKWWGEGVYERETIDGSQTQYGALRRIEAGDIIINKIWARHGSVAVVQPPLSGCFASTEFPTWIADPHRLEPRWIHWLSKTKDFWAQCDEKSRGTSGKNRIRPEKFLEICVPLPPLDEQRRIVARIEELAARIEEAQGLRAEALVGAEALLDATRAGIFQEALARGSVRLDAAATLERGRFSHRPRNDPMFFGGAHPWIQIGEIESSGKHIQHWVDTLNDEGLAVSRKFPKGTLLISIAATIGAVGILDFDCCVPDSIVGVIPNPGHDGVFLYHYLGYLRHHLEQVAPQSAQKNINLEILAPLPVPELALEQQLNIAAYLDGVEVKATELRKLQRDAAGSLNALLPSVLSKAFRGEL